MALKIHLLIIDPQNDFCDPNGSLYVKGADGDMGRLTAMIYRLDGKLDDIHFSLDSHRKIDISHPLWWKDGGGAHPGSFTQITAADVVDGRWTTTQPSAYRRTLEYLRALEAGKRYPHVVWPEHCLIGDEGHNVYAPLAASVHGWESKNYAMADIVTKGSNPWTEHFSIVQAEVPDPSDPFTQVNTGLIGTLETADVVLLAGEARSHCLANTVRDIAKNFSDPRYVQKLVLLTDATSDVGGFEGYGDAFLRDLLALGMKTSTTTEFLA